MAGYNRTRSVEQLLEKTESSPPSFIVHLHTEYWVLNNGSKFLYHNQTACLLDDIRAHRIPVDFLELFDSARVPFYEGCMIVELLDYRPQKSHEPALKNPQKTRVVLHPNPETLWADLCSLNQRHGNKWTDRDALEIESKLLLATSEPLCLDPDPHLTRIVNHVLRVSTPSMPLSLKRKASASEPEEDGPEKVKRGRMLAFMAPRENSNRTLANSFRLLDAFQAKKAAKGEDTAVAPGNQFLIAPQSQNQSPNPPTPSSQTSHAQSPADVAEGKTQKGKKLNTPQPPPYSVAFVSSGGSHTPVPPQPTHQFVNQHPPSMANMTSTIQPQVYPSFQASTEAAKRAATPAQPPQNQTQMHQQYMHYQQQSQQSQQSQAQPQPQPQPQPHLQPQQPPAQLQQQQSQLSRPPSQPRHPHQQQHPQHVQQQQGIQQPQQPQQRFTQSPKPTVNAASPIHTQPTSQPYSGATPQFQPPIPTPHFLQQPPMPRAPPKSQLAGSPPQQQQHPQQQAGASNHGQLYAQQMQQIQTQQQQQQQLQLQQQQQNQQQQNSLALMQQQRASIAQKAGGRSTPQGIQNQQQQPRPQSAAASPSPARGSPLVMHQQLAGGGVATRSSPMIAKAQIPQQGQAQQQHLPQQHPLASQSLLMQAPRAGATPQYNPSQLRTMSHASSPQAQLMTANNLQGTVNGSSMAATSPSMGGRPITPIVGPDGKPQMQQGMSMQAQQPIRRQTPLQQPQQQQLQGMNVASPQMHLNQHAQAQAQAQVVQAQAQAQAQAAAAQQQAQSQTHTPAVQVPPQMGQYPVYGYPPYNNYWRPPGMMNNATSNMTPQQQQQHLQHLHMQQQQQVAGGQGVMVNGQPTSAQMAALRAKLAMSGGQPIANHLIGKMHPTQVQAQLPNQVQAVHAQGLGKGKAGAKKGVAAKNTSGPQR